MKLNKRVYGVLGIKSVMALWNADFTGFPKTTSNDEVFGSDKALKYAIKKVWESNGEKVLYLKSYDIVKDKKKGEKIQPRDLGERYKFLFDTEDLQESTESKNILSNLFKALDVRQFGGTFAEKKNNISITGAVQVGQGLSLYSKSDYALVQEILSPFRDSTDPDGANTTIGKKIVSEEEHYFYPFVINPLAYQNYVDIDEGITLGYTEEDYKKFKDASLICATALATNSKMGCENEFALFIETEMNTYLPNLVEFINFMKNADGKDVIQLQIKELLNSFNVNLIEVYYNSSLLDIECDVDIKKYNIFTKEEV